ncbi:glycerol kinase [Methylomonas sp. HW2-6]|uniref:glycerol kinase n=1 Tax=Methylomonas sp. HW2-6 TaxID=3376687 RepID=UPI00404318B3
MSDDKHIPNTQLAKVRAITQEQMFGQLTKAGVAAGGVYLTGKYGQYVAWPEEFQLTNIPSKPDAPKLLTATVLGQQFELPANKMNYILSELGWIKKGLKGWLITEQGLAMGAEQGEDSRSSIPNVRWPEKIVRNHALKDNVDNIKGVDKPKTDADKMDSFRHKFKATHRTTDGHFVRSKAEMLIDNWLDMAEIVHAYDRKLPIEEEMYCDFYIPTGKVYIKFRGYENDAKYQARKQEKLSIY